MNIPPHENVEPIVIQDEPKLKIRLLPKREKRKTTTPDEPDKKKSKITLEASSQDADIVTDVFNRKKDNCLNPIIDSEINISPHENLEPIVIQDEPKLKIRLLPKREKRKAKAPDKPDENKCKIILEGATQEGNIITDVFNKKENNSVCQIIDDEPKIKINLFPCRIDRRSHLASANKSDVVKNVCESASNKTFETYKPKIEIHQHLVIRQPNKELNILENITDSANEKVNTEPYQKHSDTLQKLYDGIQCAKGIKSDIQVQTIVINEEPGIKIRLLPRKKSTVVENQVTEQEERNYLKSSSTYDTHHEEPHNTKDEDSIKLYCESQSNFPVNDETIGIVLPKQIEATRTTEEEKSKWKVVNEIVIDDEPTIKINLLSKKRQGKTTSITKTVKYEAIKSNNNEKKLPKHEESHSTKDEDSIKLCCESQSVFPVNDETVGIVSSKQIEATVTTEEEKNRCKVVNEIVIDEEPKIKINLLSKKRQRKTTSITKTDKCEAVKSRNNEKKLPKHEESHSTKDEDSIELYCESQSDFPVNDKTIGSFSPKKIEATVTTEEGKNICKVVNEIVIDEEAKIKINLLSKKRQGKTTSITKTDECEAIKSNNHENKLAKHEESHSTKDEDSIKLYCESQSDFPVNDETIGIVSPKQIEATTEEEKDKCNVMNEIVIDDEPTIKINLLPKKRQGKTTSITKTDKCAQLPKHEEKMFDDKNETHCKVDCSTKCQDSFKSYYESICGVQVSRAKTAANFHLSKVESSQETAEKRHISPKPTDNLIKKSCDVLDIAENAETTEINSERKIEVIGSVKEGTNKCNSINEDNGSLQILIDEEPTIKINLLPKRKQKKIKNYPEAEKSLENEKQLLDNHLRYGVKNDPHWEDSDSTKDQDSSTCLHDIVGVTKSGNVEESGLQEAQYNKEVFEKPLALQAAANLFQKSFDISDLTENNEEDIEATIKNELKRVNESNSTLQMVVIDDEPKTKVNLLSKSNKKPLNHFENSKTTCKTVDQTEDFISNKSFVEDHSKSLLDTFLNLETQYKKLNSILPEVSGDCKDNFEPVTNFVSETLANNIETDEDSEATTDKNDQMETNVNDRHELVQEINDPCDTKEDSLARDTDFEKHCDQVDSNVTQTVFSKDEGLEEVEGFGTVNDGINENRALLEGNGTVLVSPRENSYTTVVKRKIFYELDDENIQTKDHQDPMVETACGELESVELEMPVRTEIQDRTDITHNKKKSGSLIECEVSSKIVIIDEEPKIKINFLSRAKKKSQLTLCVEANDSTLDNVTNSKNEEPIEESVGDKQITKCSEQYLGQKCPTNSVENKGEGKLGCQTDTIVINEEPKIKINFLSKRKKK